MDEGLRNDVQTHTVKAAEPASLTGKAIVFVLAVLQLSKHSCNLTKNVGKLLPVAEESGINQILQSVGAVSYYAADIQAHVLAEAEQNVLPSTGNDAAEVPGNSQEIELHAPPSLPRTSINLQNELISPVFTEAVFSLESDANSTDSSDDFEFLGTSSNSTDINSSTVKFVSVPWTCCTCTYNHLPPVESSFLACAVCGTVREENTTEAVCKPEGTTAQEQLTYLDQEYDSNEAISTEESYVIDDDDDQDYEQDDFNIGTKSTRPTRTFKAKAKKAEKQKSKLECVLVPAQCIASNSDQLTTLSHDSAIKLNTRKECEINQVEQIPEKPESQPLDLATAGVERPPANLLKNLAVPALRQYASTFTKRYMLSVQSRLHHYQCAHTYPPSADSLDLVYQ